MNRCNFQDFQENWDMRSGVSKFFEVGEVH